MKDSLIKSILFGSLVLVLLYMASLYSFPLFHTLVETYIVVIAGSIFALAWNSRKSLDNHYLLFIGISYLFVGLIELLHALAYKGMGIFQGFDANLPTQLWIAARYMESLSLLIAPLYFRRKLDKNVAFAVFVPISLFLLASIFYWGFFPDCFVEGRGLTSFKKISEYVIMLILSISVFLLFGNRSKFGRDVLRMLAASMFLTILAELSFTFYISVYGLSNLIGHFFTLISFYLVHRAIIVTGLTRPLDLLYRDLAQSQLALKSANEGLETTVAERTVELIRANEQLKIELEGRKRAEEEVRRLNEELEQRVADRTSELESAVKELRDTQALVIQHEKMASIGQLAAGVAHEINNPMGFISSNLGTLSEYVKEIFTLIATYRDLLPLLNGTLGEDGPVADHIRRTQALESQMDMDFVLQDTPNLIEESREGAERIKKIVQDLRDFAHPGTRELAYADINKSLDSTLNIVWNELKYKARVKKLYGEIPEMRCCPQELNQVFMNLLVNAAQAIQKEGEIVIRTGLDDGHVEVQISDTGIGIPEENLSRIFEPFFTTKEVGKGTGLGLNVAYNIVKKHKGTIEVQSTVGKGTTFVVHIPVHGWAWTPEMRRDRSNVRET